MLKLDIGQSHQNITVHLMRFVVTGKNEIKRKEIKMMELIIVYSALWYAFSVTYG